MKVHRFFIELESKTKIVVNVLSLKMLEEAYDLAKREEETLGIKKTFINYNILDKKYKKIYQKSKNEGFLRWEQEQQVQQLSNKNIKDNNHGHKYGNPSKFEKRLFRNKNNKKNNF